MAKLLRKVFDSWRFYTLSPNEYRECMEKSFVSSNIIGLQRANIIAIILTFCFMIISIAVDRHLLIEIVYFTGFAVVVYFTGFAIALLLFIIARYIHNLYKQNRHIKHLHIIALIILYYINIMFVGLYIGVLSNPDSLDVAFIVLLIVALFLLNTSPLFKLCLTLGAMTVFIIATVSIKSPAFWHDDVLHVLTSTFITLFIGWQINKNQLSVVSGSRMTENIIGNLPGMLYQHLYNYPECTITYVSEGSKEFIGYTPEELVGGPNKFMAMVHPDDVESIGNKYEEAIKAGHAYEQAYRLIIPDGSIKWIMDRCTALERESDGTPISVQGYMFDITEQKRLETTELARLEEEAEIAEESSKAKTRFLAMMSHEIRTPMNSVMGFAELALDSMEVNMSPQLKDYLGKIKESTKWLLNIVNDILDISKIDSGKMELENVPFDLYSVLTRCESLILPDVKEKGLNLNVYAEPITGKKLLGDPLKLYQALSNILSNAVKFTNSGTVKFSSLVKNPEENNVTVYFEIKDSGIGMTQEQIRKIFEPFMQAESSTTRNYGGSGLGLSISNSIVELMGGKLFVESSPGLGSTFSFEMVFNTIDASNDDISDYTQLEDIKKPRFEGLILVCDDNIMNQQVICEHLANVGLKTVVANNGKLSIKKVEERMKKNETPFDLIFMDIFMPVMDGIEASERITALNTGTPIVALTANIMVSEIEKYSKHGIHDCLGKPFTSQELWHILLKFLEPISISVIDSNNQTEQEAKMLRHLRHNFFKSNQSTYYNLKKAADEGDNKLAERIAHTLKGNAGQIGEQCLQDAAKAVENLFREQRLGIREPETEVGELLDVLKTELDAVLVRLELMLLDAIIPKQIAAVDEKKIREIFIKLEFLLTSHNPECMNMLDEIRLIPGMEELAQQIEDFEFKKALATLEMLKEGGFTGNG